MWLRVLLSGILVVQINAQLRLDNQEIQAPRRHHDNRPVYVRVESEILQLTNEGAVSNTNAYCDAFAGACDPLVIAHLDTERPSGEWPGPVHTVYWPQVFRGDNVNSPAINKEIVRDSCGKPFRGAILRVSADDFDPASYNDHLNDWNCAITKNPDRDRQSATFTEGERCISRYYPGEKDSITLTHRYRVYHVDPSECRDEVIQSTPRPGLTTPKP